MKDLHRDRSSRPNGAGADGGTSPADTADAGNGPPPATSIRVRCPNPACGKVYTVRNSFAGKTGRCTCGAAFPITTAGAPPGDQSSPDPGQSREEDAGGKAREGGEGRRRQEATVCQGKEVAEVRVGCIGRGHAGKTALFRILGEGPVGDFFASGLHADAADPREAARMIRDAEEALQLLRRCGLPPTLQASQLRYCLYDGAEQRVAYQMREVIGQVLTHTLPDSAAEQQTRYAEYLRSLVNTHVLWAVVPCPPPDPSARDRRRYANDLRITLAYLREALRLRSLEQPAAVALVLSKVDSLFQDVEEARASLTDEVLRTSFGPLVHLVEQSRQVSDAVVVPVTAFGFGNAVLREEGGDREGARPGPEDEPFGSEPIWLLREGTSARPYNLDTLFLWTLLFGLLNQAGHGILDEDTELGHIGRMLCQDLDAADPWFLPLKGGIAEEAAQAAEIQSAH